MKSSRWAIGLAAVGVLLLGLSFLGRPSAGAEVSSPQTTTAAPDLSAADQGRALFSAKGCAACHLKGLAGAPNLAVYKVDPNFVRVWLRDPSAVRPETQMPNLNLNTAEIEALIAYLEVQSSR